METPLNNLPPFYVGQKVVAVLNHSQGAFTSGQEFVIESVEKYCCKWLVTVGIKSPAILFNCTCGKTYSKNTGLHEFCSTAFKAIDEQNFQAITFEKVLETELVCVN